MADRLPVLVLNQISASGLSRLPAERYRIEKDVADPAAILVRSADLHGRAIPASVRAIGRAGAGTNNIPVAAMTLRGVPVFNAPGANANAVKELVLAGMLMAARQIAPALRFVADLDPSAPDLDKRVEDGKKAYAGYELQGQTLGVIGLGKIGCLVADAAIKLGMNVLGFDPEITVDAAWSLPSQVRRAPASTRCSGRAVREPARAAAGGHAPPRQRRQYRPHAAGRRAAEFQPRRRGQQCRGAGSAGGRAAGGLRVRLPGAELHGHPRVVALPHLGASTREAEENCAVMVVDQLRDYLEHGQIANAVNFPSREHGARVGVPHGHRQCQRAQHAGARSPPRWRRRG